MNKNRLVVKFLTSILRTHYKVDRLASMDDVSDKQQSFSLEKVIL